MTLNKCRRSGAVAVLMAVGTYAPQALAAGNQVYFTISSSQADTTVQPGDQVTWSIAVAMTGDNQGLAVYALDLRVRSDPAVDPDPAVASVTFDQFQFTRSFNVDGNATVKPARLNSSYLVGGPGMTFTSNGTDLGGGRYVGFGGGYPVPWTVSDESVRRTPGVGRAESKAILLADPNGDYVINNGSFTAPTTAGNYVVVVTPEVASALRADLDLSQDQPSGFVVAINPSTNPQDVLQGSQFSFSVAGNTGGGGGGGGGTLPNNAPNAVATATPEQGTAPLLVEFDGSQSSDLDNDTLTYEWDFDDGTTGMGEVVQHEYADAGAYNATLVVKDGRGGSSSDTVTVTVDPPPVSNNNPTADIVTDVTSGDAPLTVQFDARGSSDQDVGDVLSYSWDFGDGTSDSGPLVTHEFTAAGTYMVTLTVDDGHGGSDMATVQITVSTPPDNNNNNNNGARAACAPGLVPISAMCLFGLFLMQRSRRRLFG